MKNSSSLVVVLTLLLSGCQDAPPSSPEPKTTAPSLIPAMVAGAVVSDTEKLELTDAKIALFSKLSGRLMDAIAQDGPAGAIAVCQGEAQAIANEVSKTANVRIGRTGVRLRNTANQPPVWAESLLSQKPAAVEFGRLTNDHAVALFPIKLQAQCLICHGPTELLAPGVKEQLAKRYPQDQATGFSEGDLRGWFWVELLD